MRPVLRISFVSFWKNFDKQDNIFYRALAKEYHVVFDGRPDIVFCSVFGNTGPAQGLVTVFYTGEPVAPPLEKYDWAFSFDYDESVKNERHMRLPLYVLGTNIREFRFDWAEVLIKSDSGSANDGIQRRTHFCAYIAFQNGFVRCLLFDRLNKKQLVIAPGRSRNNAAPITNDDAERSRRSGEWQEEKRQYLRDFRFAIACENASYPGYTSEKLIDVMIAGCIPIYWGNPEVCRDFNSRSFIDVNAYEAEEAAKVPAWIRRRSGLYKPIWHYWVMPRAVKRAVQRVIEINADERLYRKMIREPWFRDNEPTIYFDYERFRSRMMIIAQSAIARRVAERG